MTTHHSSGNNPEPMFVVDPQGIPTSALDMQQIRKAGLQLSLDMAAHSADKDELGRIAARHLEALGSGELFRYVAAGTRKRRTLPLRRRRHSEAENSSATSPQPPSGA
ncbi:hypothetical protein [Rhodococcus erythropolis]|uniref:hypothetical protein n=1 Tax=Rhodococcus erythropolis TaxID=1833 RepID=UPI003671288C